MDIIVITSPEPVPGEAFLINTLLEEGIDRVHIRKPGASADDHRRLIEAIDQRWWKRLSLHDHHELSTEYGVGVHLNGRNPNPPEGAKGLLSSSCHSLEEVVERKKQCDYVFLSPIFNSISKQGYSSAFTESDIKNAAQSGIIDERVMALGGISAENISVVADYGFGGAVMLGDVWNRVNDGFVEHVRMLVSMK